MPAAFTYHARKSLVRWHRPVLPAQVKLAGPHKLGCLLLPLPPDAAKELNDWCLEAVPDWWLGPGGRELSPHVTVLYGFTQDTPGQLAALRAFLAREGPCRIGLGSLDAFPGGKDGVPLFLHVDGPQLEDMNYSLRETFPAEVKFPDYVPHVCVAYLDPQFVELAKRLDCPLAGRELTLGTAVYSNPAGDKTEIPLSLLPPLWGVKAQPAAAAAGNEPKASGTRKDSLGRERCYQDGKLVPCNKPEETDADDNNSGVGESQAPGRTRLTDAELLTDQQQPGQQPPAEPVQDTSDPQFQREWAAEVEKQLAEIEQANVAAYEYSPQEIAAEQNWHSEFIQWRWGLKMPGADGQGQLLAIRPADVGPAARFISGLLNPLLGGAAYVAGLLDKLAGRPPKSKTESEVGKQLQAYFDALNPDSSANAPAAELAAAVLGPQALPIAQQLVSLPATGEQRKLSDKAKVPTPAELEAAGAPDDVKIRAAADPEYARRWADKQRRIKVQQNRAKKKQEKQDALDPEERQAQQEQEKAKLAARRAKQEARGVQQRAAQEKQDRRFAAVRGRLTDAELERWWRMPPGERNRFLAGKERENKVAVPKSRVGKGLLGYAAKAMCEAGQTVTQTGCTPASGQGGQKPRKAKRPGEPAAAEPGTRPALGKPGADGKFPSTDSARVWAAEVYETGPEYDAVQAEALGDYSGFAYKQVNGLLRGSWDGGDDPEFRTQIENIVKQLDAAVASRRTTDDVVAYRGVRGLDLEPGDRFFDNGFTSTTFDRGIAQEFADQQRADGVRGLVLELEVPAGTPAAFVSLATGGTENEMLLPRGGRFEVVGRDGGVVRAKWLGAKP